MLLQMQLSTMPIRLLLHIRLVRRSSSSRLARLLSHLGLSLQAQLPNLRSTLHARIRNQSLSIQPMAVRSLLIRRIILYFNRCMHSLLDRSHLGHLDLMPNTNVTSLASTIRR